MSVNFDKTQELDALEAVPRHMQGYTTPRVNLLPPEIYEAARFRRTQFGLAGAVALVAVGLVGGWAYSSYQVGVAQDQLTQANSTASLLKNEEARYAEVPKLLNKIDAIENAEAQAMSQDVAWYSQLDGLNQVFPNGMTFKTLTVTFNEGTTTSGGSPLATPGAIGTITIEGQGPTYVNTADWLDALADRPGLVDPYFTVADDAYDSELKKNLVKVSSTVQFTDKVLTHRFDRKAN